jgi:23S rRNA (adenine2503-C2)-methyltransferase
MPHRRLLSKPFGRNPVNLFALAPPAVRALVERLTWPTYRAGQVLRWLYRERARAIDEMTNLSKPDRAALRAEAEIARFSPDGPLFRSTDGTRKFLFELGGGLTVESILIPDGRRLTLCVSTQVGCTLDCGFCLTGQLGLKKNLAAHEIVDQVLTVLDRLDAEERLTNLVFMGMGEPLANFDAVADAVTRLTDTTWGVGIAPRRITLSTAGLATRLQDAIDLGVNLAVSLNAPTDSLRAQLMPAANRIAPLPDLLAACRALRLSDRDRLTFEYVLLAGINDREEQAAQLATLLRDLRCKINLIPFNEFPGSSYRRPEQAAIHRFQLRLRRAGYDVLVRRSRGPDVLGACGQLGNGAPHASTPILTPARRLVTNHSRQAARAHATQSTNGRT